MKSRLLQAVCLLITIPVILLSSGVQASAEEPISSFDQVTLNFEYMLDGDVKCIVVVGSKPGGTAGLYTGFCDTWSASAFWECGLLEEGCQEMTLQLTGSGCSRDIPVNQYNFREVGLKNSVNLNSAFVPSGSCEFRRVCLSIEYDGHGGGYEGMGNLKTECGAISMDVAIGEACDGVTIGAIKELDPVVGNPTTFERAYYRRVELSYTWNGVGTAPAFYIVQRGFGSWAVGQTLVGPVRAQHVFLQGNAVTTVVQVQASAPWGFREDPPAAAVAMEPFELVGAGFIAGPARDLNQFTFTLPTTDARGQIGRTSDEHCVYYWGEQLYEAPGTQDVPRGPLPGPGDDEETDGPPSLEPPEDEDKDDSNFGWILRLLSGIKAAISGVVGAITDAVEAIVSGLQRLLIPKEFPDWSRVSITLPSGWMPDFQTMDLNGTCGQMGLPALSVPDVGSVEPDFQVNTCESPWSTARNLIYFGSLAYIGVVLWNRALRAVMSGSGMGVEGGGD